MANADSVGQQTASSFGNYAIAQANGVSLAATGNAIVAMPFFGGGLTVGPSASSSGEVIVRRITVQNNTGNVAAANVTIYTSSDGNTSNAVVAATVLSALNVQGKYQDLTVASPYNVNTSITGTTTQCLFVGVNTASANGTIDIRVYGDTVSF
jgi:hypothetical protein